MRIVCVTGGRGKREGKEVGVRKWEGRRKTRATLISFR
jgi:hypothetical protein